jgi:hypothetical protein
MTEALISTRGTVVLSECAGLWAGSFGVLAVGSWRPAWSGDEAATVLVVRRTWAGVARTFAFDPALEPYYLLMKTWSIPSTSECWLRLPSILAMATAATVLFVLATRLASRRFGLLAALVLLILPATSRYAQDARPYALSVLVVALTALCWEPDRATGRPRWAGLAFLVVLAGLVHAHALLIVPVLIAAAWLAPRVDRRREVIATATACCSGVVLISPFLYVLGRRAKGQAEPAPVTLINVAKESLRLPAGVLSPPLAGPLALAVLGLAAAGCAIGWRSGGRHKQAAVLAAVWVGLPPVALSVLQIMTGSPGLLARYWTLCLPALALAAGLTLDALWSRNRLLAATCLAGLVCLAAPTHVDMRSEDGHLGQRWRDLPQVMALPAIRGAPLLVEGWTYRALVSNDPNLAARMPLIIDPTATGRVNPQVGGPDSEPFRRLTRDHHVVVVLQAEAGFSPALPTRASFWSFPGEVRAFRTAAVLCAYFGEPLGVFTKTRHTLRESEARLLAEQIASIEPSAIRCAPAGS